MNSYSEKLRKERREALALRSLSTIDIEEVEVPISTLYSYEIEVEDTEFGFVPPFIKANMIKGLEKKLAAETDDEKKTEIQAKIDKLKGSDKKAELAAKLAAMDEESEEFGALPPFLKANIIKGLEKKLAAESDDEKKAEIQAKIDKLNGGGKKEELASILGYILEGDGEAFAKEYKFKEAQHPRSKDGKFSKSGSGGSDQRGVKGQVVNKNIEDKGKNLAERDALEKDAAKIESELKDIEGEDSQLSDEYFKEVDRLSDELKKLPEGHPGKHSIDSDRYREILNLKQKNTEKRWDAEKRLRLAKDGIESITKKIPKRGSGRAL